MDANSNVLKEFKNIASSYKTERLASGKNERTKSHHHKSHVSAQTQWICSQIKISSIDFDPLRMYDKGNVCKTGNTHCTILYRRVDLNVIPESVGFKT